MIGLVVILAVTLVSALGFWLAGPPLLAWLCALAGLSLAFRLWVMYRRAGLHLGGSSEIEITVINDQIMASVWTYMLLLAVYLVGVLGADWAGYNDGLDQWLERNGGINGWVSCCNFTTPRYIVPPLEKGGGRIVWHMIATAQISALVWGGTLLVLAFMAKRSAPWLTFTLRRLGPLELPGARSTGWGSFLRLVFALVILMGLWKMAGESGGVANEKEKISGMLHLLDPRVNPALFLVLQIITSLLIIFCFSLAAGLMVTDAFPGLGRVVTIGARPPDTAALTPPAEMGRLASSGPKRERISGRQPSHDRLLPPADRGNELPEN